MVDIAKLDVFEDEKSVQFGSFSAPNVFADGVSQFMLGVPMSKLVFYSVYGEDEKGREIRKAVQVINIPTTSLLQFVGSLQIAVGESQGQLLEMSESEHVSIMKKMISRVCGETSENK